MQVSVIIKGQLKLSGVKLGSGTRFNIHNPRISAADLRILRGGGGGGGSGQEFVEGAGSSKRQFRGNFHTDKQNKKKSGGVKPLDPSLDLIRDLGSDSKLWGDFC